MPSKAFLHLTVEGVVAIHGVVLKAHGGSPGVRDQALLESAVAAPQATFAGESLMKDGLEIAAAYLFYLCRNHAFVDGNKRTAAAAAISFLTTNGVQFPKDDGSVYRAMIEIANKQLDKIGLANVLRRLSGNTR